MIFGCGRTGLFSNSLYRGLPGLTFIFPRQHSSSPRTKTPLFITLFFILQRPVLLWRSAELFHSAPGREEGLQYSVVAKHSPFYCSLINRRQNAALRSRWFPSSCKHYRRKNSWDVSYMWWNRSSLISSGSIVTYDWEGIAFNVGMRDKTAIK